MLEQDKQFELYKTMMYLAIDDPNAIANVSMKTLISLSKLNDDSTEEFERILSHMREEYKNLLSLDGVVILSMLSELISKEDLDELKVILKNLDDD